MITLPVQAEGRGLSACLACARKHDRRFRVRAGPFLSDTAPSGEGRQACGTKRVISPALIIGALRGVPAGRGRRRQRSRSASGESFPRPIGNFVPVMFDIAFQSFMVAE